MRGGSLSLQQQRPQDGEAQDLLSAAGGPVAGGPSDLLDERIGKQIWHPESVHETTQV